MLERLFAWLALTSALSLYIMARYTPAVPVPSPILAFLIVFALIGLFVGIIFALITTVGKLRH